MPAMSRFMSRSKRPWNTGPCAGTRRPLSFEGMASLHHVATQPGDVMGHQEEDRRVHYRRRASTDHNGSPSTLRSRATGSSLSAFLSGLALSRPAVAVSDKRLDRPHRVRRFHLGNKADGFYADNAVPIAFSGVRACSMRSSRACTSSKPKGRCGCCPWRFPKPPSVTVC